MLVSLYDKNAANKLKEQVQVQVQEEKKERKNCVERDKRVNYRSHVIISHGPAFFLSFQAFPQIDKLIVAA